MKIIFLGCQGSGKSTQAKMIAQKLNLPHIEMGQLLRERAKENDEIGKGIDKELKLGHLIKNDITINLLNKKLKGNEFEKGYILDGYPRNKEQLNALENNIDKVFYVNISDEEAIRRLSKRGRNDDIGEALIKRLEIYHDQTEPLLKKFESKGILDEIDGQRSIEEIYENIQKRLKNEN